MGGHGDVVRSQAKMLEQLFRMAGFAKAVLHADSYHRCGQVLAQDFGHRSAQPAVNLGFFGGNYVAGTLGTFQNSFGVLRFECRYVHHFGVNTILSQSRSRSHGLVSHGTGSN